MNARGGSVANCVHLRCEPFISCQLTAGLTGARDVALCVWCSTGVVFVPGAEPVWVAAAGNIRDKTTCHKSPTNKHWVNR